MSPDALHEKHSRNLQGEAALQQVWRYKGSCCKSQTVSKFVHLVALKSPDPVTSGSIPEHRKAVFAGARQKVAIRCDWTEGVHTRDSPAMTADVCDTAGFEIALARVRNLTSFSTSNYP